MRRVAGFEQVAEVKAFPRYAVAVAFLGDDSLLVAGGRGLVLYRTADWSLVAGANAHEASVDALSVTPDGSLAATASVDGTVRLWDLPGLRVLRTLKGHTKTVAGVALTPDGTLVASASYDRTARLWDARSGEELHRLAHPANVTAVAFAPAGWLVATGGLGDYVRLWTLDGEDVGEFHAHDRAVNALQFSKDGLALYSTGADHTLAAHSVDDWKLVRRVALVDGGVHSIALSPDGDFAALTGDHAVEIVDLHVAEAVNELAVTAKGVYGVAWSPGGDMIAAAGADGKVRVWRAG